MDDNGNKEKLKIKQNNNVLYVNGEKKEYENVKKASEMYEKKIKKCLKNGFKNVNFILRYYFSLTHKLNAHFSPEITGNPACLL